MDGELTDQLLDRFLHKDLHERVTLINQIREISVEIADILQDVLYVGLDANNLVVEGPMCAHGKSLAHHNAQVLIQSRTRAVIPDYNLIR